MRKLWLALMLVGCGDNREGIQPTDRRTLEIAAQCERLSRCGLFDSVDACTKYFPTIPQVSELAAIDHSIIVFDSLAEEACLRALASASCDSTSDEARVVPIACQGALQGTRKAGAMCAFNEECDTGRCEIGVCEPGECCAGSCKPARAAGGTCQQHLDCIDGEYCGADHVCVPLVAAGGACASDASCVYGLACTGASGTALGTCRKLPRIGEPCPYQRCAEIGARCDATGTCVRVGLPGDACMTNSDCSPYVDCNETTAKCEAFPELGMPCTTQCQGDAHCEDGLCSPPLSIASVCRANTDCESRLCIEGSIYYQCAPRPVCY